MSIGTTPPKIKTPAPSERHDQERSAIGDLPSAIFHCYLINTSLLPRRCASTAGERGAPRPSTIHNRFSGFSITHRFEPSLSPRLVAPKLLAKAEALVEVEAFNPDPSDPSATSDSPL